MQRLSKRVWMERESGVRVREERHVLVVEEKEAGDLSEGCEQRIRWSCAGACVCVFGKTSLCPLESKEETSKTGHVCLSLFQNVLPRCFPGSPSERNDQDQDSCECGEERGETTTGLTVLCDGDSGTNEYRITQERDLLNPFTVCSATNTCLLSMRMRSLSSGSHSFLIFGRETPHGGKETGFLIQSTLGRERQIVKG